MHQFFMPDRHKDHMRDMFRRGRLSSSPSFYMFNPIAIDPDAAPAGSSVLYFLVPVPAAPELDWDGAGGALADRVLERAEQLLLPGLRIPSARASSAHRQMRSALACIGGAASASRRCCPNPEASGRRSSRCR